MKRSGEETRAAVLVLAGLPGAGKTSVARCLNSHFQFHVLSRDEVKRTLFGLDDVGDAQNKIAFEAMLSALPLLVERGKRVVVDGMPFDKVGQAEAVGAAVGDSCRFSVVLVDTPVVVAQERLSVPDPEGPADRTPDLVLRISENFRDVPPSWLRISGTEAPAANAQRISDLLDEG